MRSLAGWCVALLSAMILASCGDAGEFVKTAEFEAQEVREWEEWREGRLTRLKADDGWLTLVGLFWMEDGSTNAVGSDPGSKIKLPGKAPAKVGTVTLNAGKAFFTPSDGIGLAATELHHDNEDNFNVLQLGDVRFYLIERGGRYGIRVKDAAGPARQNFTSLEYYPFDSTWNVHAKLTPDPHKVIFDTEAGVQEHYESPGYLEFDRAGEHYKIDAVTEDDELYLVFRDATSGKSTYGAARFIYSKQPDENGETWVDFNRAYNPPCVFTEFATCPLPPPTNRLKVAVEAGEKKYTGPTAHAAVAE